MNIDAADVISESTLVVYFTDDSWALFRVEDLLALAPVREKKEGLAPGEGAPPLRSAAGTDRD